MLSAPQKENKRSTGCQGRLLTKHRDETGAGLKAMTTTNIQVEVAWLWMIHGSSHKPLLGVVASAGPAEARMILSCRNVT